ncbi:hypothetical protein [Kordia jejudonensis]|uniref:hypothetical protein n=1 Tax=Kordia jejudonensis TaxID=1348245 RepID=UPI000629A903|nr:hypothetical protein [Kordia jejudonensis]
MIKDYSRPLTEAEKKRLAKKVTYIKKQRSKNIQSVLVKIGVLIIFGGIIYAFYSLWLLLPILLISFFMIWMLWIQLKDILNYPKNSKNLYTVMDSGIVEVTEIHIDRCMKINNYNDEGNHFIVEFEGQLSLIGGQEFLGIRKLKNKIEYITIMNEERTGIYDERIKKTGNAIVPYYTFKKGVPETLFNSELWDNLTSGAPFSGKLEDLDEYMVVDKS